MASTIPSTLRHALGGEVTDEMIDQIHQVAGGNFRSVDMIIPRILELEQRNRQRLADGTVKMNEIIKCGRRPLDDLGDRSRNRSADMRGGEKLEA